MATSISFSPSNDFLATAHVDSVGVFLWYVWFKYDFQLILTVCRANRAQYTDVFFQGVNPKDVFDISLPSVQGHAEDKGHHSLRTYFVFSLILNLQPLKN